VARKKIKSATDQRKFTLIYNDFIESNLLNYYEKMIFIVLKKYADNNTMKAFPSLNKLHKVTGISLSQVKRSINHMKELGVINVEHRNNEIKGHQSNIYTLYDYAEIWSVDTDSSEEHSITITEQISEMKLVAELRSRGYFVTKEKELASDSDQTTDTSTHINNLNIHKNTTNKIESQVERYTMEDIKELYEYDSLIIQYPKKLTDIDIVFDILYDNLNTQKQTIRVNGEDKPRMVVIGKLMKLQPDDLIYSINKYHEQTERIKNVKAYLLTILYHAKEQSHLDLMNLGHHNGDF
jgi:hypothetical protein